jgi:hypothetical protein
MLGDGDDGFSVTSLVMQRDNMMQRDILTHADCYDSIILLLPK